MRRSLVAIHIVGLALWLGSLTFSVALAGVLFSSVKHPICPACSRAWETPKDLLACATCGALQHAECATKNHGCALEHEGSHECRTLAVSDGGGALPADAAPVPSRTLTGTSEWARVRVASNVEVTAARRILWRLDGATAALEDAEGHVPLVGSCYVEPRPAVGDALARSFDLAQALALACGVLALGTVLLTSPGGALRFLRAGVLALALGLGAWSILLAGRVATQRIPLEAPQGATHEQRARFGATHGLSSVAGTLELALVLVALALATLRRDEAPAATTPPVATPPPSPPA